MIYILGNYIPYTPYGILQNGSARVKRKLIIIKSNPFQPIKLLLFAANYRFYNLRIVLMLLRLASHFSMVDRLKLRIRCKRESMTDMLLRISRRLE